MNIALCGRFNTDIRHQGGSAEVLLALAKELSKRHTVTLFGRGKPQQSIIDMCKENKTDFFYVPSDTAINIILGPIRAIFLLKKNFKDFDIIHTHTGSYAFAATFFREKCKIVVHVHEPSIVRGIKGNSFSASIYLFLENLITRFSVLKANLIITPSEDMKVVISNKWKPSARIVVVPNGINEVFFRKGPKDAVHNPLRILYVGRLSFQKRPERLVEAMKSLKELAHLTIVGDGELRGRLEDVVRESRITNISFEGERYGDELREYYRNSDVFLIASDHEGMPLVILEAMGSGLPVIGSNVTGIRELTDGVGILVGEPYAENFARALTMLMTDLVEFKALSLRGIRKAKQYCWSEISTKYEGLYEGILSK